MSTDRQPQKTSRRTYLASLITGSSLISLSGCSGSGDDESDDQGPTDGQETNSDGTDAGTDGGSDDQEPTDGQETNSDGTDAGTDNGTDEPSPPDLQVTGITGPNQATVYDEINLTITMTNKGGEPGELSTELTVTTPRNSIVVDHSRSIEPGATEEIEVSDVVLDGVGNTTFTVDGTDQSHTVEVAPVNVAVGEQTQVGGELNAELSIETPNGVFYSERVTAGLDSGDATRVFSPIGDNDLVIVYIELENTGTSMQSISLADFNFDPITFFDGLPGGQELSAVELDATIVSGDEELNVDVAQSERYALLGQVSDSDRDIESFSFDSVTETSEPEVMFDVSNVEMRSPDIEITSVNAPSTAPQGESFQISLNAVNNGGSGVFRGVFQYDRSDTQWDLSTVTNTRIEMEVDAGEVFTVQTLNQAERSGEFTYRFTPTDAVWVTEIQ